MDSTLSAHLNSSVKNLFRQVSIGHIPNIINNITHLALLCENKFSFHFEIGNEQNAIYWCARPFYIGEGVRDRELERERERGVWSPG